MYKHLSNMGKLGCNSLTKIHMAFQVFISLREDMMMDDVSYKYNSDTDFIYLLARPSEEVELDIIIPVQGYLSTTLEDLERLQIILSNLHQKEHKRIILAICEPDSTIVFYEISPEFTPFTEESVYSDHHWNKEKYDLYCTQDENNVEGTERNEDFQEENTGRVYLKEPNVMTDTNNVTYKNDSENYSSNINISSDLENDSNYSDEYTFDPSDSNADVG